MAKSAAWLEREYKQAMRTSRREYRDKLYQATIAKEKVTELDDLLWIY